MEFEDARMGKEGKCPTTICILYSREGATVLSTVARTVDGKIKYEGATKDVEGRCYCRCICRRDVRMRR